MSTFDEREKLLIDKLSATDPLGQVVQVAKNLPQEEATKILRYATSSGDAPDVVAANLPAYDKDALGTTDWEATLQNAPKTKVFLSNPLPLAIVGNGDNAKVLAGLETENKVWASIKEGAKDVARGTLGAFQGIAENLTKGSIVNRNEMPPEYQMWHAQGGETLLHDTADLLKAATGSQMLAPKEVKADTQLGQYGLDIARMTPQIAAQIATYLLTGGAGSLLFMGSQIAGSDYLELRGKGVEPGRAMTAATVDAAIQAPLENVGLGKIMKAIPAKATAAKKLAAFAESGLTEGVTEWLQQYPDTATKIYAENPDATPQQMTQMFAQEFVNATKEGLYQGAVAAPFGFLGGAVKIAMQRKVAEAYNEHIDALHAVMDQTDLVNKSPEVVEQHLEAVTDGAKTYIDPDALVLYQTENPKVLEELGVTEQELNNALKTGEMVEVSEARYVVATKQNPEIQQALKNDIAPTTDGMTSNRLKEMQRNDRDVKRATDKTLADRKEMKAWADEYRADLEGKGFSREQADQIIVGLQANARVMQADNPVEWLRSKAPEFRMGNNQDIDAAALGQSAKPETGKPFTMNYYHNTEKAPKMAGDEFAQSIEPAGEYIGHDELAGTNKLPNFEYGSISFSNPLVLEHKTTGHGGWKTDLSAMFGGKKGKALSTAIKKAGHDGVITLDENGNISETVNLSGTKAEAYSQSAGITNTPEFKAWFGDSKVVDEQGKPLVVYHGTGQEFSAFDQNKTMDGVFWFTSDRGKLERGEVGAAGHGKVMPVYLSAKKLAGWDEYEKYSLDELMQQGYDGVKLDDDYIVFNPEQIKSVNNSGAFDPNNPNIYFQAKKTYTVIKESGKLYAAAAEKFPEIVAERKVKRRVEGAIQQTLDFGQAEGDITGRASAQQSLFGTDEGAEAPADVPGRKAAPVRREKRLARQIGLGITRELVINGAVSLVGRKVGSIQELAEIAQVLRHPGYEKFHRIYTDADGNIVYHETVATMLPAEASICSPEDEGLSANLFARMDHDIKASGATKMYLVHNHPSTNPTPSKEDIAVTKWLANATHINGSLSAFSQAFAGHIVLDTDKYSAIDRNGQVREGVIDTQHQINYAEAGTPHIALGDNGYSGNGLYSAAKKLADGSHTTAFFMTTKGEIRGIVQLPDAAAQMAPDRITRYLRWLARANYSNYCSITTSDKAAFDVYKSLVEKDQLTDVLLTTDGRSVRTWRPSAKEWFGIPLGSQTNNKRLLETGDEYNQAAWHGSPHMFDKFSLGHIGSGEGNQAYGWGLYFAGNKKIAQWYKETLADTPVATFDGKTFNDLQAEGDEIGAIALQGLAQYADSTDTDTAIKNAEKAFEEIIGMTPEVNSNDAETATIKKALEWLHDNGSRISLEGNTGALYEVDIKAEESEMLDWDKPFTEQSDYVKSILAAMRDKYRETDGREGVYFNDDWTGKEIYESGFNWRSGNDNNPEGKSKALNAAGIKAIKYLDASSRSRREGDYNYVVFDDNAVELMNRYNQAVMRSDVNGSIHWENGKAIITMMQTGNPSTVIHEMVGHFFFQNLIERAKMDDAPEQVKKDLATLFEWAGYAGKDFDELDRAQRTDLHEKVARAAEAYVMTGKAPSVATQSLFRRFAEWMKDVYQSVRSLGVEVTPEVAAVFDRMLATDAEIAELEAVEEYHKALPETFLASLDERQRARLDKQLANVRAEAEERLRAAVMRDLRADNREQIAEERKTAQEQIRTALSREPLYMARAAMQAPANMKAVQAAIDARIEEIIAAQVDFLVRNAKLGVESKAPVRDEEGYMTGEWLSGFSNNQQWYKDLLGRLPQGRLPEAWSKYIDWVKAGSVVEEGEKPRRMPPKMREAFRDIAIEHLEKGWYDAQFGDVPGDAEFLALRQGSPGWEFIYDNGGGLKLNEAQAREMYPDKIDKLPQNMLAKDGGFDADTLAQVFGFSSGDELLARIIDSPTLTEAVNAALKDHMAQFRGLLENKEAMQEEARNAMYNDGGAALLAYEKEVIDLIADRMINGRPVSGEQLIKEWTRAQEAHLHRRQLEELKAAERDKSAQKMAELKEKHAQQVAALKEKQQERIAELAELAKQKEAEAKADKKQKDYEQRWLAAEQRMIADITRAADQEEFNRRVETAREAARATAHAQLAKRTITEATNLQSYIAAERRAAADAAKFLQKGDYDNAAAAKERQLLNHAFVQESLAIRRESERIKRYLRKQRKTQNWMSYTADENGLRVKTSEFRDQSGAILERFGFKRRDFVQPEETLAAWVQRQEADEVNGGIVNIAPWLAYDNTRKTVGKLTLEELQDVENAIRNIKKIAQIGSNSDGMAFIEGGGKEEIIAGLQDSAARLNTRQVDKIEKNKTSWRRNMLAGMKQEHRMFEALDGFKSFGRWFNTFYSSVKRAADFRSQLLRRVTDRLEEAFASEGVTKTDRYRMAHKHIYIPEWRQSVTKNTLLAIALNMGNKGNLDRLTASRLVGVSMNVKWDADSIKAVLEKNLTASDFRLVGKIWKAIDVYEEYNSMVKRMTGNALPKVEPVPIEFTVGGETIRLEGGYYPLSQDTRGSKQAELNAEKKLGDTPGLMPYPSTGRSKARTKGAKYAVDTDLGSLYGNITDIIQDIAFRPVAHDLNRLMRDERIINTIRDKLGDEEYRAILEWQKRVTNGRPESIKHPMDAFFTWARSSAVISSLLLRPGTAVQNIANVALYGGSVDGFTNRDAIAAYMKHGWSDYIPNALMNTERAKMLREFVYSKSEQMRDKKAAPDSSFREINQAGEGENPLMRAGNERVQEAGYKVEKARESLNRFASDVFAWIDQLTDIPMWLGAYDKALSDGKTEAQAVAFADAVILNSTGTGRNIDTSNLLASGNTTARLFTMFQTFMNTAYNRWAKETNVYLVEKDAARLVKFAAVQYLTFGMLSAVLSFKTPDEDDDTLKWFAKEVLEWPLGMIPLFGGIAKTMLDKAMGFYSYGFRMSPVESKAEDFLKLASTVQKVAEGKKDKGDIVEPAAGLASFFMRYPDQLNDWFFNAYDILFGKMEPQASDLVKRRPARERQ